VGRPKRPYNGVEHINWSGDQWLHGQTVGGIGVRDRQRREKQQKWAYPTVNGIYDPLTYLHVLDTLANIDPDIELRANNLVVFLDSAFENWVFDNITVGKVLAELWEYIEEKMGGKGLGLLEAGNDYKGRFYRIHHNMDTARMYQALRRDLVRLVEIEMAQRKRGEKPARLETPLLECPSVREEWVEEAV
jgi:hypothetical protein